MAVVIFLVSLLPGIFYLWLIWRQDKYEPEPGRWVAIVFFLGMLSAFPAGLIEALVDFFIYPFWNGALHGDIKSVVISSFLIIAPVEEFCKVWPMILIATNRRIFNEPMDALIYGCSASLGFASLENSVYTLWAGSPTFLIRAFFAFPAHVFCASMWGWGFGMWRFRMRGFKGFSVFLASFIFSVLFHGFYDSLILSKRAALIVAVFSLLIVGFGVVFLAFYHFRRVSPFRWSLLPPGIRTAQRKAATEKFRGGLSVGWITGGIFIYGFIILASFTVAGFIKGALSGFKSVTMNFFLITTYHISGGTILILYGVIGMMFVLAGIVIGRMSRTKTIIEPAISSIISLSLLLVFMAERSGSEGFLIWLIAGPLFFGLSCLGGYLGELWQEKSS